MKLPVVNRKRVQIIAAVVGLVGANLALIPAAHATTYMTHASVLEYNMNASTTSSVAIAFTAGAADAAGTVTVNFGSWGGTVNATQTVATTNCQTITGATNVLPSGTSLAAAGSGSTVTISNVSALTSGSSYCAILTSTSAVTNPAATGVYPVILTDAADTATTAVDVITNDQVSVSATVPPTFTMSLSGNTDAFGSLSSTGLTATGGVTTTIATNGNYGWYLSAMDSNAGLRSTSQAKTIASVATGSNTAMNGGKIGTEAYALGVTTGNATTNYADAGGITGSGLSTTVYNQIASGTAATNGATVTTKELADVAATTPAATDYADTVSLVGAGSF
jgi:hypothetical protein